ncbi:oleate hydratase [Bradyrhizobium sp. Pa8]|uniref:oleate hydratase n=1 Tax=Bradyrhizobium sp. Pa8 TaxID=3386552 RepID=UPI00403EF7AF
MYYSSGNYEAFARPRKPDTADKKTAWFIGAGLAALAGAAFLIRDGHIAGKRITILERLMLPGGALDGAKQHEKGFVIRGGREMEDHFECLWDLFRSIPSLEVEGASVLDEFYWLNKDDPNCSLQRATVNRGQDAHTDGLFNLTGKAQRELTTIFLANPRDMEKKRIDEVLGQDLLNSNFWLYWRTMFAFEEWHSALEMKRYLHRFIHHIGGLPDFSALKFTKYNQYESLILPLCNWLTRQGVIFQFGVEVTDVDFEIRPGYKQATHIKYKRDGISGGIDLCADDLVFVTIGSLTENSDTGDHHTPAKLNEGPAPAWDLWRRIASKSAAFGRPDVFGGNVHATKWESATITTLDTRIPNYICKIAKRDPFSGKVVTGGIVTVKDSSWLLSWTVNRQPHFKHQPKDQIIVWLYSLFVDRLGDFVKKSMQDCTGAEVTQEWLYHLGVPVAEIPQLAETGAKTVPVMMPYVTSLFMPRQAGDRPDIVPKEAANFAFIGQFAESAERDCVFTTEYSVRTAMEATYTLLNIDRGVPQVFNSTYDVRKILAAIARLRDSKEMQIEPAFLRKLLQEAVEAPVLRELLEGHQVIPN